MIPLRRLSSYFRAVWKLRGYKPKGPTLRRFHRWVTQFPEEHRADLARLAANLRFISEEETISALLELNRGILRELVADGVGMRSVIYVETDSAGSSSGVMLNLLRDRANLERRGACFLHARDANGIREATRKVRSGAIIYVDDFSGTGRQFSRSREAVADEVEGSFSEFFLLRCICEEARVRVGELGVEPHARIVHAKSERPLLGECAFFSPESRERLGALARCHWPARVNTLGFGGLATNVVFYTNAPNTTPLILRGHRGQAPLRGIVPRFDDLEVEE